MRPGYLGAVKDDREEVKQGIRRGETTVRDAGTEVE